MRASRQNQIEEWGGGVGPRIAPQSGWSPDGLSRAASRRIRRARGLIGLLLVVFSLTGAIGPVAIGAQAAPVEAGRITQAAEFIVVDPVKAESKTPAREGRTAYTLPKDKLEKATRLAHARIVLYLVGTVWGIGFLIVMLALQMVAKLRDWAAAITPRPWVAGLVFLPAVLALISLADLPLSLAGQHLSLAYGQSIQSWPSWLWDWTKSLGLSIAIGTFALSLLFAIIRHSRRWWLWFWLISLPLQVLVIFAVPYVIDPLFNHFEPLAKSNPALVDQLERVVARSNLQIPPSRMFLMKASEKVTSLNAYVTGFGASKRVVVWDTTIQKCTPDEILFIFGHEQGHYALDHIRIGLIASAIGSFFGLWIGFHALRWVVARFGQRWRVATVEDWGAVVVLLLVFAVGSFLSEPINNGFSRVLEHHADIYGQEVIHGLVADPRQTATSAFQRLGEISLDDPRPSVLVEFWAYSHPSITRRVAFAAQYDPWGLGRRPRYFPAKAP